MSLGASLLRLGRASRETAEKWAGLLVHPFSHRKCLMSLLHHYYGWADSLPEPPHRPGALPSLQPRVQRIPAHVLDEIWACAVHLPLSVSFLRWPVDEELSSTDATLKKGGITRAPLPGEAANLMWRQVEVKGENVRLDWSREGALPPPCEMRPPNQDVADLSEALQHRITQS